MEIKQAAHQTRGVSHLWLCLFTLVVIVALRGYDYSAGIAVAGSVACAATVRASLSPLVRTYIVFVLLGLVIAPRFGTSLSSEVETAELLAALWIVAASLGGVLASLRKERRTIFQARPFLEPITPALVVSMASLVAVYVLQSRDSFGLAGQLATGVSGGGYLGLLAQVGPPCAAGALLSTLGRPTAARGTLVLSAGLVVLEAASLAYSGFRGAAPLYIIAIAICATGVRAPWRNRSIGKRAFGGALVLGLMIGLFALGVSVREHAASAAGTGQGTTTMSNFLPTMISRFDESNALNAAWESRNDPSARRAVFLGDQVTSIIPRFLYPEKGTVDYGPQVAIAVYGAPSTTRTSSTVTMFGDALINLGLAGGVMLVVAHVFSFDTAFRWLRSAATVPSMSIRTAVVVAALNNEAPSVLNIIGTIRVSLAIVALQWIVKRVISKSHAPPLSLQAGKANTEFPVTPL